MHFHHHTLNVMYPHTYDEIEIPKLKLSLLPSIFQKTRKWLLQSYIDIELF